MINFFDQVLNAISFSNLDGGFFLGLNTPLQFQGNALKCADGPVSDSPAQHPANNDQQGRETGQYQHALVKKQLNVLKRNHLCRPFS